MRLPASLVFTALVAAVTLPAEPAHAETVVVKLATLVPQGSEWHRALQEMGQQWQRISSGQVTLRLYPGGVAGDDADIVRKMRLGTLGGGLISPTGLQEIDRSVLGLAIPMGFDTYEQFDCAVGKLGPVFEAVLADKGFVVLAWADAGFVRFFTKNPVRTPDDLRRQKLFAWAGDDKFIEVWKKGGFNAVPLPSTEISTALSTGLVNALPTTPQAAVLFGWFNSAKNMTDVPWGVLYGAIVVSKTTWEKIPADLRPRLLKAARETGVKLQQITRAAEPKDIAAMQKRGLNVIRPDEAAMAQWRRLLDEIVPKVRGSFLPSDQIDRALAVRNQCRQNKP